MCVCVWLYKFITQYNCIQKWFRKLCKGKAARPSSYMGLTFLYPSLHLLVLKVFLRHHSDDHVDHQLGPTPTIHPEVVPPVFNPAGGHRENCTKIIPFMRT